MTQAPLLLSRLARALVHYLESAVEYPYARLVSTSQVGVIGVVNIELDIEVSQRPRVAIKRLEPVSLQFRAADDAVSPWVLSTRADFPLGHVHTTLERYAAGVGLCIWEEDWPDLSRSLTAEALVERLRSWFARMADGNLHDEGQELEPLIPRNSDSLILPPGHIHGDLHIVFAQKYADQWAVRLSEEKPSQEVAFNDFGVFQGRLNPVTQRGLTAGPQSFEHLVDLCISLDYDLISKLKAWLTEPLQLDRAGERFVLLVLNVPKRRSDQSSDETSEIWAYTLDVSLAVLGERLGATMTEQGMTVQSILPPTQAPDLRSITMLSWRVIQRLDRAKARTFAGTALGRDYNLLAIGAGAIGSNVAMTAARAGIGPWCIVDDDIVLPHNTVRQAQRDPWVGRLKAEALAAELNHIHATQGNGSICANFLTPDGYGGQLEAAVNAADLVIDFSASPSVLGAIADRPVKQAASFFFGPDGSDLVVMVEGKERDIRLDEVEAQYFWAVAADERLSGHLNAARVDRIRYANACNDLSQPLPPWQVASLCGIAAGRLPGLLESVNASSTVWRLNPSTGNVAAVEMELNPVYRASGEGMRVSISGEVIRTMRALRQSAAPNETGGVILGHFDLIRNIVHVVAALPAPPDSRQAPSYFVRGKHDLKPKVDKIITATAGCLQYVGEWHSHPDHAVARPSSDDESVFDFLKSYFEPAGSPYLMIICGKSETWYRAGWQQRGLLEGVVSHANE